MIYTIKRTSNYNNKKPCKEAKKRTFEEWHTRTCNEAEFDKRFSEREGLWRSKGKNHSITREGYITRQEGFQKRWSVEINTIEELNSFIEKNGRIIIGWDDYAKDVYNIEIYDDWRE